MEAQDFKPTEEKPPKSLSKRTHEDIPKVKVAVNHGQGYVWDSLDVLRLWRDYRVVGSLVGTLPRHPHQSTTLGLPLSLMPEEVTLLLKEGLGETVKYKQMEEKPSQVLKDMFSECRERCYREQVEEAGRQRMEQVKRMADKILEGKRKKFLMKQKKEKTKELNADGQETKGREEEAFTLTKEDVIQEEEEKLQPLAPHLQVVEVFTRHPLLNHLTSESCPWPHPATHHEQVRSKVFIDLWHQGFYLTSGIKFGGDFLVYRGNPHLYHAHAIVRCVKREQLHRGGECDLVAATRVAAATKKTFVLAALNRSGQVVYRSYHWLEEQEEESMDSSDEEL